MPSPPPSARGRPADAAGAPEGRIAALDLVRLLAALAVVGWHWLFGGVYMQPYVQHGLPGLAWLGQYGFLGVQVFFVISGFVIAMSLQGRGVRAFAVARFIRLYPAYWICGALTLAARWLLGEAPFPACGGGCALANATMFNGFFDQPHFVDPSYWTLEIELRFYLMVALLLLIRGERRLFEAVLVWMLLSVDGLVAEDHEWAVFGLLSARWAPFFGTGVMLYLVRREGRPRHWLGLALGWLLASLYVAQKVAHYARVPVPEAFSPVVAVALFSGFLLLVVSIARGLIAMQPSRLTAACGGMSYTVYLLHQVLGILLINRLAGRLPDAGIYALCLGIVLLTGFLSWRWAERPLQQWLRRRWAAPPAAVAAPVAPSATA